MPCWNSWNNYRYLSFFSKIIIIFYYIIVGLRDQRCSGFCRKGYYCPEQSSSFYQVPCPPGRYGSVDGLPSSNCSGLCPEGYHCPLGTDDPHLNKCGGSNNYCPIGSSKPLEVKLGYYSIGGSDEFTRSGQTICDIGYYCKDGLRVSCPMGTFGNKSGLYADFFNYTYSEYNSINTTIQGLVLYPTPSPITITNLPTMKPLHSKSPTIKSTTKPTFKPAISEYPSYLPTSRPSHVPTGELIESFGSTMTPTTVDQRLYTHFFCSGFLLIAI